MSVSDGPVIQAFKNVTANGIFSTKDSRGRRTPVNKTPDVSVERVTKQIERFPVMESHYCRRSTSRMYLDSNLSISKMYELYTNDCKNDSAEPVSLITYRRIFCKNYNYSFFKPKKDQCLTCTNYKNADGEHRQALEADYLLHTERATKASEAKDTDKEKSNADDTFLSASFDLQSVLQMPFTETSQMYYLRKVNVYNLCIYESKIPNNGYCLVCSELNGKRGSLEIGSGLFWWINQLPRTVKHLSVF